MKELLKNPLTYVVLYLVGRYYVRNKPDSTASKLIKEVTDSGEQLIDSTSDFIAETVDLATETTEDLVNIAQGFGQEAGSALETALAPEMNSDPTGEEEDPGSEGSGQPGFAGRNKIDNENTYYDANNSIGSNRDNFTFSGNLDDFNNNAPELA